MCVTYPLDPQRKGKGACKQTSQITRGGRAPPWVLGVACYTLHISCILPLPRALLASTAMLRLNARATRSRSHIGSYRPPQDFKRTNRGASPQRSRRLSTRSRRLLSPHDGSQAVGIRSIRSACLPSRRCHHRASSSLRCLCVLLWPLLFVG